MGVAGFSAIEARAPLARSSRARRMGAAAASTWNVPRGALRHSIIPNELVRPVLDTLRSFTWGVFPFATLLGGLVAGVDVRLPYLIAAIVTLLGTALAVRLLLKASRYSEPRED